VKELLKADAICKSFAQMKKAPVFFQLSVYFINNIVSIGDSVFMNADTFA